MKTVAFRYGWSEGPWHTKQFEKLLNSKGFDVMNDTRKADVVVAHSLGCFMLPAKMEAKRVILIGIPYWPGKSVIKSLTNNLRHEAKQKKGFIWWLKRSIHAAYYATLRAPYTFSGLRKRSKLRFNLPSDPSGVIMIRNELDGFCHPDIQKILPQTAKYRLINVGGGHEDWWINPAPYVDLILKHL